MYISIALSPSLVYIYFMLNSNMSLVYMYILYMLVLNNTPFVHARVYLQYLNSALPGVWTL